MLLFEPYQNLLSLLGSIPFPLVFGGIGFFGILLLVIHSVKKVETFVLTHRLIKKIGAVYAPEAIRRVVHHFQERYIIGGNREDRLSLTSYLINTFFHPAFEGNHRILLEGEIGAGKSSQFIQLLKSYSRLLKKRPYRMRIVSLEQANVLEQIKAFSRPEKIILLIDGLELDAAAHLDYRKRIDELLITTEKFARVVLAIPTGFFPAHLYSTTVPSEFHYIGHECYEIFERIELSPLKSTSARKLQKKLAAHLSFSQAKKHRKLVRSQPALFQVPGMLDWSRDLNLVEQAGAASTFPYEVIAAHVYRQFGRVPGDTNGLSRLFGFHVAFAGELFQQQSRGHGNQLPHARVQSLLVKHQLGEEAIAKGGLLHKAGNLWGVQHPGFWAFWLAWQGYHHHKIPEETSFATFPLARQLYQEMCWKGFLQSPLGAEAMCRTNLDTQKVAASDIGFREIQHISRLYLTDPAFGDFRFLRNLSGLKAIHIYQSEHDSPPVALVSELPSQEVLVYLYDDSGEFQVWKQQSLAAELVSHFDEENRLEISASEMRPYHLADSPNPWQPLKRPPSVRPPSRLLVQLFKTPVQELAHGRKPSRSLVARADDQIVDNFEVVLGGGEMELFDRIQVIDFKDQSRNLVCYHQNDSTLLEQQLNQIVNQLIQVMGEDDDHLEDFSQDDLAQIEDGHWLGRRWTWKNSDAYAYGAHLYMDRPGRASLHIFGLDRRTSERKAAA